MDNIGNGQVILPIEKYTELYTAAMELQKLKDNNFGVEVYEDYNKEPRIRVLVTNESMKRAFDKVKDQWPEHEFAYKGDATEEVYSAISAKKPEVPTLDLKEDLY